MPGISRSAREKASTSDARSSAFNPARGRNSTTCAITSLLGRLFSRRPSRLLRAAFRRAWRQRLRLARPRRRFGLRLAARLWLAVRSGRARRRLLVAFEAPPRRVELAPPRGLELSPRCFLAELVAVRLGA